jgi:hypothetical protein
VIAGLLLLLAGAVHLGIEHAPGWWGGTPAAWAYVGYGLEALCLWLLAARLVRNSPARWPLWAVCAYGAWESLQRAGCRLMLPMDRAPQLSDGQTICQAAGVPGWAIAPAVLALVAASVARPCKV